MEVSQGKAERTFVKESVFALGFGALLSSLADIALRNECRKYEDLGIGIEFARLISAQEIECTSGSCSTEPAASFQPI